MGSKYRLFVAILLSYYCCLLGFNGFILAQSFADSVASSSVSASSNNNNNVGQTSGHLRPMISVHKMHNHMDSYQRSERLHKFDLFVDPVCEQVHRLSDGQLNKFYSQLNAFSQNSNHGLAGCFGENGFNFDPNNRDQLSNFCSARTLYTDQYRKFIACANQIWRPIIDQDIDRALRERVKSRLNKESSDIIQADILRDIISHIHSDQDDEIYNELGETAQLAFQQPQSVAALPLAESNGNLLGKLIVEAAANQVSNNEQQAFSSAQVTIPTTQTINNSNFFNERTNNNAQISLSPETSNPFAIQEEIPLKTAILPIIVVPTESLSQNSVGGASASATSNNLGQSDLATGSAIAAASSVKSQQEQQHHQQQAMQQPESASLAAATSAIASNVGPATTLAANAQTATEPISALAPAATTTTTINQQQEQHQQVPATQQVPSGAQLSTPEPVPIGQAATASASVATASADTLHETPAAGPHLPPSAVSALASSSADLLQTGSQPSPAPATKSSATASAATSNTEKPVSRMANDVSSSSTTTDSSSASAATSATSASSASSASSAETATSATTTQTTTTTTTSTTSSLQLPSEANPAEPTTAASVPPTSAPIEPVMSFTAAAGARAAVAPPQIESQVTEEKAADVAAATAAATPASALQLHNPNLPIPVEGDLNGAAGTVSSSATATETADLDASAAGAQSGAGAIEPGEESAIASAPAATQIDTVEQNQAGASAVGGDTAGAAATATELEETAPLASVSEAIEPVEGEPATDSAANAATGAQVEPEEAVEMTQTDVSAGASTAELPTAPIADTLPPSEVAGAGLGAIAGAGIADAAKVAGGLSDTTATSAAGAEGVAETSSTAAAAGVGSADSEAGSEESPITDAGAATASENIAADPMEPIAAPVNQAASVGTFDKGLAGAEPVDVAGEVGAANTIEQVEPVDASAAGVAGAPESSDATAASDSIGLPNDTNAASSGAVAGAGEVVEAASSAGVAGSLETVEQPNELHAVGADTAATGESGATGLPTDVAAPTSMATTGPVDAPEQAEIGSASAAAVGVAAAAETSEIGQTGSGLAEGDDANVAVGSTGLPIEVDAASAAGATLPLGAVEQPELTGVSAAATPPNGLPEAAEIQDESAGASGVGVSAVPNVPKVVGTGGLNEIADPGAAAVAGGAMNSVGVGSLLGADAGAAAGSHVSGLADPANAAAVASSANPLGEIDQSGLAAGGGAAADAGAGQVAPAVEGATAAAGATAQPVPIDADPIDTAVGVGVGATVGQDLNESGATTTAAAGASAGAASELAQHDQNGEAAAATTAATVDQENAQQHSAVFAPKVHDVIVMGPHVEGDDKAFDYEDHHDHHLEIAGASAGAEAAAGDQHTHHDHHGDGALLINHEDNSMHQDTNTQTVAQSSTSLENNNTQNVEQATVATAPTDSATTTAPPSDQLAVPDANAGIERVKHLIEGHYDYADHSDHEHLLRGLQTGDIVHVDAGEQDTIGGVETQ